MKWTTVILIVLAVLVVGLLVVIGIQYVQNKKLSSDNDLVHSDLNLLSTTSADNTAAYTARMEQLQTGLSDSQSTVAALQRSKQTRDREDSEFTAATGLTLNELKQLFSGGTSGDSQSDAAISRLEEFGSRHGSTDEGQGAGVPSYPQ
jgi:predicted negative regulator of RcsB-dependent stress response